MKSNNMVSSLIFKSIERFSVKGLGLIVSIVLARLLSPDEFGQVAIITVFVNLCFTFVESGLNTALIQSKKVDKVDYSTVFYISFAVALLLAGVLVIIAPFIGRLYDNSALVLPLQVYSASLLVSAYNSIQTAKLQKEMKFKLILYTSLASTFLAGAIGIIMAYKGAGIWSLIGYYFSYNIINVLMVLVLDRWMPCLKFSVRRAKELFSYGWKMLVSGLLCTLYADIRTLIIGKMFSENKLGYYNRGQQFPVLVSGTVETTIYSVVFPAMSKVQDNSTDVVRLMRNSSKIGSFILMPLQAGLCATAAPLMSFLLTDKWLPAVPFMQMICIGGTSIAISVAGLTAIKSIGRSDVYMKLEAVRRAAMIGVLMISVFAFRTVEAIAWGYAISAWIDIAIISVPTKRLLGYGLFAQIKDVWKIIFASAAMFGIVFAIGFVSLPAWALLLIQIPVGVLSYTLICILLRVDCLIDLISKIRGRKEQSKV
jgi:O-antigen/teichoic acid export membrane protein